MTSPQKPLEFSSWEELTSQEWSQLLNLVVREEAERNLSVFYKILPRAIDALPNRAPITNELPLRGQSLREHGPEIAVGCEISKLKGKTRQRMIQGFSIALSGAVQSKYEDWHAHVQGLFSLAQVVEGVLERSMLDKALARKGMPPRLRNEIKEARESLKH